MDDTLWTPNDKLKNSKTLCQLVGICHWAFVGSLVMNYDEDAYYTLVKFVKYKPFDNPKVRVRHFVITVV